VHALFFHSELFENFPNVSGREDFMFKDFSNTTWIRGKYIMETVKNHFQCHSFTGGKFLFNHLLKLVPLEDEGTISSSKSHFEKLTFGDELMVSDEFINAKFSKMSLAVAKDSGFYEVDLEEGDLYLWGKGQGCGLLQKKCDAFVSPNLCEKENQVKCDPTHRLRTKCKFLEFSDGCGVMQNLVDCRQFKESKSRVYSYGPGSVCLESKVFG
jgi:hypothetical protein